MTGGDGLAALDLEGVEREVDPGGEGVVLVDRDIEAAEKGKAYAHKLVTDQINKGRAKTADRDALLARIRTIESEIASAAGRPKPRRSFAAFSKG